MIIVEGIKKGEYYRLRDKNAKQPKHWGIPISDWTEFRNKVRKVKTTVNSPIYGTKITFEDSRWLWPASLYEKVAEPHYFDDGTKWKSKGTGDVYSLKRVGNKLKTISSTGFENGSMDSIDMLLATYEFVEESTAKKLTIEEMRKIAKSNRFEDFKVGQTVTVVYPSISCGTVGKVTSTRGYSIIVEGTPAYWGDPRSLYIHKDSQASLAKNVSLEKKKEKGMIKKKKVSKKAKAKKSKRIGYTVRALMRNGAAAKFGINVGDVITKVDGRSVAAKGSLGKVLSTFKNGAKVSINVTKLDGRKVFIRNVVLGRNKAGRASLGVISGRKKAAVYNAKREVAVKKSTKTAEKLVKGALKDEKNPFMARAEVEMAEAMALMADMKGRDAIMKAKRLKSSLRKELNAGVLKSEDMVHEYLEALRGNAAAKKAEVDEIIENTGKPGKRRLSRIGKIIFGLAGTAAASAGVYYGVVYALTLI